jgi:hypothetical protein
VDKTQQRLAQIEQSENSVEKTLQMSQKEYEKHLQKLHDELIVAWNSEERVKSLKIAIQVSFRFPLLIPQAAKLLGDTSVIKFYPSKFVLATEILDTFGRLVYERISKKTGESTKGWNLFLLF